MDQPGDFLDRTRWRVVRVGESDVDPVAPRAVEFWNGRVSGQVGVNRFTGEYSIEGDTVVIGRLARTLMAGAPEMMELEDRFHAAFAGRLPVAVGETMRLGRIELSYTAPSRVRGSVWYRERMALPPGSSVVVELLGPSTEVVAVQIIDDAVGSPIEFELDAGAPLENPPYQIRARVEAPDGHVMWEAATHIDLERQPVELMLVRA